MISLVLLFIVFCVACGGNSNDTSTDTDTNANTNTDTSTETDTDTDTESKPVKYVITWIDENGSTLSSNEVVEGEVPNYNYEKSDTAEWDYTVEGWSLSQDGEVLSSIPAAKENATYYAIVSKVKQKYTVIFNSNGGSNVDSQVVEYGSLAVLPDEPTFEGHKFMGWCTDEGGENPVDFSQAITGDTEYYAIWNDVVDVKALLNSLLSGYNLSPYNYIPESMKPDFSANLVKKDDIITDYSNGFTNISDISYGFGEQYHLVLDNLEQTNLFYNVLTVVEGLSATSISAFNNYFDKNPADTAHHSFENGIYNITIDFDGKTISYILDYTAELPLVGEQTVQIALTMDIETSERVVRIQLGDANALAYTITENSYEFAIKYLGVRRAMFTIERDDNGDIYGSIYEYLTVSSAEIASCAEFYITEDYVSVVGNKASGLIGFTGYINELYDVNTGKLLGYEVQETLSAVKYDTLWFNLNDIGGISSIKYQPAEGKEAAKVFINGSSTQWQAKKALLSRRFDIELRTQYVYSYDATEQKYVEHKIEVPMIFVQEKYYDTFIDDVEATNDVTVSVEVSNEDLEKILEDYDTLIPIFVENKDKVTVDIIIAYIGDKITF
ncbi:MAG: InlB B-repeat-containing protein [Clostridia bacterium]|nr:InlB B-repeat-containing protein [Clostridia bacterium]